MNNQIEKWRQGEQALDAERRLMKDALARLGQTETTMTMRRAPGRLIFGLDLTGSREARINQARIATAAMFTTIRTVGAMEVKLIFYRGTNEVRATNWCNDAEALSRYMRGLACESGLTQIARLLRLALAETGTISGVVLVLDHCEDDPDELCEMAETLGRRSTKIFIFHECADHDERSLLAKPFFKRMAELSGGVYVEFKPDSGTVLREMLSSVATLSAGGTEAVQRMARPTTAEARHLQTRLLLGSGGRK